MPGYKNGGLKKNKYIIKKSNGKPIDETARYFALKYYAEKSEYDPHAIVAFQSYANSVRKDNPILADEIQRELNFIKEKEEQSLRFGKAMNSVEDSLPSVWHIDNNDRR